jgi:hypothetical protein
MIRTDPSIPLQFSDISPLGIPYEVLAVITIAVVAAIYFFFRTSVEGMPVYVKWVTETGVTFRFKAKEDLRGVFLYIKGAGGKVIETVKKVGIPMDVSDIAEKDMKAYLVKFSDETKKVYLTVRPSKMKNYREYTVIEGTGQTVDWKTKKTDVDPADQGNTALMQEESSGFKKVLKDLEEGGKTFADVVMGWVPGIGIGFGLTFVILLLFGRLH